MHRDLLSKIFCGPNKGRFFTDVSAVRHLTSESVQSPALSFKCIDDMHRSDGLSFRVFCIGDCIADNVFQKHFQDPAFLLVDETGDSLYTSSASQTTNSWFSDTLDIVTKNFPVTLGASFAQTLSSFSSS